MTHNYIQGKPIGIHEKINVARRLLLPVAAHNADPEIYDEPWTSGRELAKFPLEMRNKFWRHEYWLHTGGRVEGELKREVHCLATFGPEIYIKRRKND